MRTIMTISGTSGLSARIAAGKIDEIYEAVNTHRHQLTSFGFSRGFLGVSVFSYLYGLHSGREEFMDEARQTFDQACRHDRGRSPEELSAGFRGAGRGFTIPPPGRRPRPRPQHIPRGCGYDLVKENALRGEQQEHRRVRERSAGIRAVFSAAQPLRPRKCGTYRRRTDPRHYKGCRPYEPGMFLDIGN